VLCGLTRVVWHYTRPPQNTKKNRSPFIKNCFLKERRREVEGFSQRWPANKRYWVDLVWFFCACYHRDSSNPASGVEKEDLTTMSGCSASRRTALRNYIMTFLKTQFLIVVRLCRKSQPFRERAYFQELHVEKVKLNANFANASLGLHQLLVAFPE